MDETPGALTQLVISAEQTRTNTPTTNRYNLFMKHLLENISKKNIPVDKIFLDIAEAVCAENNESQRLSCKNGLPRDRKIFLNEILPGM